MAIPSILVVAHKKNLVAELTNRSVHVSKIPTLGGIAIFAGISVSINIFGDFYVFNEFRFILAAAILLFFVGIKDDILVIAPITKLMGQIIAASILVVLADLRLTDLHGFWDIHEIGYLASYLLTVFVMIVIINGMNLIDGIDGLASGIGITVALCYAIYFYLSKNYELSLLAFAIVGAYSAFFYFNLFSKTQKIFMGDTGSLLLGLFLTILVVEFNEYNIDLSKPFSVNSAPSVSIGIMMIPLFDIIRVMLIRIGLGRSPFKPDRNHIHHKLLRLGYSHKKSTAILIVVNLFFIAFSFYFQFVSIRRLLMLLILIAMILTYLPDFIYQRKKRNYDIP
jgi:UDP-N-acetylmuramyl pentapeptide phosphotransferase/UDP-N-acetylglucosamine-1-phosphate transferase